MEYRVSFTLSEKDFKDFEENNKKHTPPYKDYIVDKLFTIEEVIDLLKTKTDIIYGLATFKYARLLLCLKQDNGKTRGEIFDLLNEISSQYFPRFIKSKTLFKKAVNEDFERLI